MLFIIYDLEATCWNDESPLSEQEVIEIGAYKMNRYGEITGSFSKFVKPLLHPNLSYYCKNLTSIEQEDINKAKTFDRVVPEFIHWIEDEGEEFKLCSWGEKDIPMLIHDCGLHRMDIDWLDANFDVKRHYNAMKNLHKPVGLKNALRREGLEFEGTAHRAIDDAYNLCRIFARYVDMWSY